METINVFSELQIGDIINNINELSVIPYQLNLVQNTKNFYNALEGNEGDGVSAQTIKGNTIFNLNRFIRAINNIVLEIEKRSSYINSLYKVYTYKTDFANNHCVILTHGINTHGEWTSVIGSKLQEHGFERIIVKGFVKKFKFFLGVGRYESVKQLLETLISREKISKNQTYSIIAHSYGTLILAKALALANSLGLKLSFNKIILTGSIIPTNYEWTTYLHEDTSSVKIKKVFNICGDSDIWPVVASRFVSDAGHSGTFFFNQDDKHIINIRLPNVCHTNMLNKENFFDNYLKFLCNDEFVLKEENCRCSRTARFLFWLFFLES